MKRTIYLMAAIACLCIVSCNKSEEVITPANSTNAPEILAKKVQGTAIIDLRGTVKNVSSQYIQLRIRFRGITNNGDSITGYAANRRTFDHIGNFNFKLGPDHGMRFTGMIIENGTSAHIRGSGDFDLDDEIINANQPFSFTGVNMSYKANMN